MTGALIVVLLAGILLAAELSQQSSTSNALGSWFGMNLTPTQIAQVAQNAGFSGDDLTIAVAVALAESSGNPQAVGDQSLAPTRGPSKGLWQINIGSHAHPEYAAVDLTDPQTNANAAYAVYEAADYTFNPWSTFNPRDGSTPRYLAYMDQAQSGIQTV